MKKSKNITPKGNFKLFDSNYFFLFKSHILINNLFNIKYKLLSLRELKLTF